ncbi:PREDICTED: ribosomal RNA processing protein 1 homolog A isoform X1 [Galeopterus variegatus]|uniref:Ribosomal RNA processing protein 1 homolog A isoform X1 n=1 Tax=Galeopterus variegatus TaxID=482537 RepID=A0ABM0S493_GALVR|nr:PREDICTED: ribosomal RNA processing protein 1 homolog A isoform X1 [Galeopterus variegatus]
MWMQDKPLLQEELGRTISQLIHAFQTTETQHLFLQTFWQTMNREWPGIDRLRLDKYYMLMRMVLNESLKAVRMQGWEERQVKQLLELLTTEILHPNSQAPNGVKSHFLEIFLEELSKVGAQELTAEQNLRFIDPFCRIAARTKDPLVLHNITRGIFEKIVEQAPFAIEDLMNEVDTQEEEEEVSEGDDDSSGSGERGQGLPSSKWSKKPPAGEAHDTSGLGRLCWLSQFGLLWDHPSRLLAGPFFLPSPSVFSRHSSRYDLWKWKACMGFALPKPSMASGVFRALLGLPGLLCASHPPPQAQLAPWTSPCPPGLGLPVTLRGCPDYLLTVQPPRLYLAAHAGPLHAAYHFMLHSSLVCIRHSWPVSPTRTGSCPCIGHGRAPIACGWMKEGNMLLQTGPTEGLWDGAVVLWQRWGPGGVLLASRLGTAGQCLTPPGGLFPEHCVLLL